MTDQTSRVNLELVYDSDCPNVETARQVIAAALREAGEPLTWKEWDREGDDTPVGIRGFGSPTILVNGQDVTGDGNAAAQADANSCRVYRDACGCMSGTPSVQMIVSAINAVTR